MSTEQFPPDRPPVQPLENPVESRRYIDLPLFELDNSEQVVDFTLLKRSAEHGVLDPADEDELTGLPNRRWLMRSLDMLVESQPGKFSLLFVDVNGLKEHNDTHGHEAGNRLLIETADTLRDNTRGNATGRPIEAERRQREVATDQPTRIVARLSGDEFVVLLPGAHDPEQLQLISDRLKDRLAEKNISASMGGYTHRADETAGQLVHRADQKMFEDKQAIYKRRLEDLPRRKQLAYRVAGLLSKYSGYRAPR